ncbi:branched-chain amino acid aminotransferase [Bacillus sp. AFS015802]|uniref:branched-chain amino acid aminotransferase n=1 Tax=Bacillus sp. AFS015802 TaxID=2033486 RepID=UPI000BF5242A|nr:branched-chain amino acid aminotransferase [Bacillus sp. AFS015802]PFA62167.1 branched-chain amino acid aminotransferase [Bacillus sp. AFS015802]
MLRKKLQQFIEETKESKGTVPLYELEREYALKHGILHAEDVTPAKGDSRFQNAYIERCDKETEELINQETVEFLNKPIAYLKEHKNEFVYLESEWFSVIGVEAVSVEVDDVFGTYDAMLGLKLQKKYRSQIEGYLEEVLQDDSSFDLLFNGEDGLWDLNFTLNDHADFHEGLLMLEVYGLIYEFLFNLLKHIDEN